MQRDKKASHFMSLYLTNKETIMFVELKEINSRPAPFQYYTADELWANKHTAEQMLHYHCYRL